MLYEYLHDSVKKTDTKNLFYLEYLFATDKALPWVLLKGTDLFLRHLTALSMSVNTNFIPRWKDSLENLNFCSVSGY